MTQDSTGLTDNSPLDDILVDAGSFRERLGTSVRVFPTLSSSSAVTVPCGRPVHGVFRFANSSSNHAHSVKTLRALLPEHDSARYQLHALQEIGDVISAHDVITGRRRSQTLRSTVSIQSEPRG